MPAQLVHVVDDDASVRRSLVRLLNANDLEAKPFASAEEFLASEAATPGGCVLLDYELPGMNGLELQQILVRGESVWEVVFLSGHAEIRQRLERATGGAVEFLAKPAKPADLIAAVQRALARVAAHRAAAPDSGSPPAPKSLRCK